MKSNFKTTFVLCLMLGAMFTEMKAQNNEDSVLKTKISELTAKMNSSKTNTGNLLSGRPAPIVVTEGHELYRDPKTLNLQLDFDLTQDNQYRATPIIATPLTGKELDKIKGLVYSKKTGQ